MSLHFTTLVLVTKHRVFDSSYPPPTFTPDISSASFHPPPPPLSKHPPPPPPPPLSFIMTIGDFSDLREPRVGGRELQSRAYTTLDIDGAQAGTWRKPKCGARPSSSLCTSDIAGAQSKILIPRKPNKRLDLGLNCSDVVGAVPTKRIWATRCVNPNERNYNYPADRPFTASPVHNTRDLPFCGDITTYVPQIRVKATHRQHQYLDYSDVEGSKPCNRKARFRQDNTHDKSVQNAASKKSAKKPYDPLNPVYVYDVPKAVMAKGSDAAYEWAKETSYDPGSHAKKGKARKSRPLLSLSLDGIEGSRPGNPWVPIHFPKQRRTSVHKSNDVSDIPGATRSRTVGSLRTSSATPGVPVRVTDPNNPCYLTSYQQGALKGISIAEVRETEAMLDDIALVTNLP